MSNILSRYTTLIEAGLNRLLPNTDESYKNLRDAMQYSLMAGGKRLRPALVLEFCSVCGGNTEAAVNFACAVEMIHTYSLIHDDLPCMDNDDLRRGRPSCHKQYGEATALLAGDALQPLAFSAIALSGLPDGRCVRAAAVLAECCGVNGMVGGQTIDLNSEQTGADARTLMLMHRLKTGALIRAACCLGCIAAGRYDLLPAAEKYAESVGLAFQIQDDVLDCIGDATLLGKPTGSDIQNNKVTYVSLYGLDEAKQLIVQYTNDAITALEPFDEAANGLRELARYLAGRSN